MRWTRETEAAQQKRAREWQRVFAWRPRVYRQDEDTEIVMWLEFVLCKSRDNDGMYPWLYRPITLLEKDVNPTAT
jgi:hypothetical protein